MTAAATSDFTWARQFAGQDVGYLNTDSVDFTAGMVLKLDATNALGALTVTQTQIGLLQAGAAAYPFGVAVESCVHTSAVPYNQSRCQRDGLVQVVASAAITAGAILACAASGKVATQTSGQPQLGQAVSAAAANNDLIVVAISIANNA